MKSPKPMKYPFHLLKAFEKHPLTLTEEIDYVTKINQLTKCRISYFMPNRPRKIDYMDESKSDNQNQLNYIIALDKYIKRIDGIETEVSWAKNKIKKLISINNLLKEDFEALKRLSQRRKYFINAKK